MKKYLFTKLLCSTLLGAILLFTTSRPLSLAQTGSLGSEIDYFLGNVGAIGYLLWQYSGERISPIETDQYSFYKGDPLCAVMKEKAAQYPGKFLGVNIHSLSRHPESFMRDTFSYLKNECGTTVIRIFGDQGRGGPAAVRATLDVAQQYGIKLIVASIDWTNNYSRQGVDPTQWYATGYQTAGTLDYTRQLAQTIGGHPALYAIELANEPHCQGFTTCIEPYMRWVQSVSGAIKSVTSSQVGIGQMATPDGRGDSPGGDFRRSNSFGTINIASGHYYTSAMRDAVVKAAGESPKPFYIGEASATLVADVSKNLTPGEDPIVPKPDPYVPCQDTRPEDSILSSQKEGEYHSLRPYQASPCNKKIEDTALYCGNDLIVKRTYTVKPSDAKSCVGLPDGGQRCTYDYIHSQTQTGVQMDLASAELPIMGNTENVPNQYNNGNNIRPPAIPLVARMNEYVSWYLNGVIQRAEEKELDVNKPTDQYRLINLSGPLKKLLPERVQRAERLKTIANGTQAKSQNGGLSGEQNDNLSKIKRYLIGGNSPIEYNWNHDQIVGCIMRNGSLVGDLIQCSQKAYSQTLTNIITPQAAIRLSDFLKTNPNSGNIPNMPPFEEDYMVNGKLDFTRFWTAYKNWMAKENCLDIPFFGGRICIPAFGLRATYWGKIFAMVPFSGTEDRLGQVSLPSQPSTVDSTFNLNTGTVTQPPSEVQVSEIKFVPNNPKHKLYFSHMKEDSDLSDLVQGTYAPQSVPWYKADIDDGKDAYKTDHCEIKDARKNPGDDLFGNYNQPQNSPIRDSSDTTVQGTVSYRAQFTCDFPPPTLNGGCVQLCLQQRRTDCNSACSSPPPDCKKVALVALSVYTKTPLVNKIWKQLVDGQASVVRRFYPQVGPNTPIQELKDIPASTKAMYQGASTGGPGTTEIYAGDPNAGRNGSDANLFFPHIGSIYDYFLKGIQKALHPKDTSGRVSNDLPPVTNRQCNVADPTKVTAKEVLGANYVVTDRLIQLALEASKYTCTPAEVIIAVILSETRGRNLTNLDGIGSPTFPVWMQNEFPITGDPNEKVCRYADCLRSGLNANTPFGPFSWYEGYYVNQVRAYQEIRDQGLQCIQGMGISPSTLNETDLDPRLVGQSTCVTSAKFWMSIHDANPSLPACSGSSQKPFTLSEVDSGAINIAFRHFCGSDPICNTYLDKYNAVMSAYAPEVERIRNELRDCLNRSNTAPL